jgi:hypothetical protein
MGDRLSSEWVPHTRDQNQAILDMLGLVSDFGASRATKSDST